MDVSILVLTLNEENNIIGCLDTLTWSNDIIILDSFSSDNTVNIANEFGVKVIQRKFDNWSNHQNWAVKNIKFKNRWVLYIDADERCTDALKNEIIAMPDPEDDCSAFRIRRKDFFMGKWLKHAQLYPTWLVRLFKPQNISYSRLVNPLAKVEGKTFQLQSHINHYPFSKGIANWVERHNKYSDMEAIENYKLHQSYKISWNGLLSNDPNIYRSILKDIFYKLPFRPIIKFIYYYILRMGFLDGRPGFVYSALQAYYEFLIILKLEEIRSNKKDLLL